MRRRGEAMVRSARSRLGATSLGLAAPFLAITAAVPGGLLDDVDRDAVDAAHDVVRDRPALVDGLEAVSFLGGAPWLLPFVTLAVVVLVLRRHRRAALFLAVTCASGAIANDLLKALVGRDRPSFADPVSSAHGLSFPSGHAMAATVCYGALVLVLAGGLARRQRRLAVVAAAVLALAIGATRVLLGVHYPSDVVAGHVVGLAWLSGAATLLGPVREEPQPSAAPAPAPVA